MYLHVVCMCVLSAGVNNVFLVKSKSILAIQHNDRSPLENMHCAILYEGKLMLHWAYALLN